MEMVDYDDPMKNGPDDHTPAERQAMYDQSVLHAKDLTGNLIWHDWDGRMSTSPVSPEMFIDVKIRCGEVIENFKAGTFCWKHSDNEDAVCDIVSFRPSAKMSVDYNVASPKLSMVRTFGKQPYDWAGVSAVEITWTLYLNGILILPSMRRFPWTSEQSVMDTYASQPYSAIQTLHDRIAEALSLS